jgi:hypothetical protein
MTSELDHLLDQIERLKNDPLGIPLNATPLDGLIAIYRNPRLGEGLRFKAMAEAAKYMHYRMGVNVQVNTFAERLDEVIERRQARGRLVNQPKVIEAKPEGSGRFKRRV